MTDMLENKDTELLEAQKALNHMKKTTVSEEELKSAQAALEASQQALDVQVRENMVMNEHLKAFEAKVLTINAEKERYLEELLKIKSDQVEQYDSINSMQAELEKKSKEIKE